MQWHLKLSERPYNAIIAGTKQVEVRAPDPEHGQDFRNAVPGYSERIAKYGLVALRITVTQQ
jgi:hypothetical protein